MPDGEERAPEVGRQKRVEVLGRGLGQRFDGAENTGIGEEPVEAPEPGMNRGDRRRDRRFVGDVTGDGEGRSALRRDLRGELVERFPPPAEEREGGAFLGEPQGAGAPHAGTGAGDEDGLVDESREGHGKLRRGRDVDGDCISISNDDNRL